MIKVHITLTLVWSVTADHQLLKMCLWFVLQTFLRQKPGQQRRTSCWVFTNIIIIYIYTVFCLVPKCLCINLRSLNLNWEPAGEQGREQKCALWGCLFKPKVEKCRSLRGLKGPSHYKQHKLSSLLQLCFKLARCAVTMDKVKKWKWNPRIWLVKLSLLDLSVSSFCFYLLTQWSEWIWIYVAWQRRWWSRFREWAPVVSQL